MPVSVVIPLYNKARHIRWAIRSVLSQTWQDFELIVVDDGSTDGGEEVVRQFADPRIRLIVQPNAGVSAARNRGIQKASADLIAFLDADDEWLPNFLATVMGLRARHPEAGIYASAYRYAKEGTSWRPDFTACDVPPEGSLLPDYFRAALGPPPVWSSAVMIPKKILAEVGCFPVGIPRGEDLCVWTRIALRYPVAWAPVEGAIYHLSADNRACNMPSPNLDFPAAAEIEAASESEARNTPLVHMAREYLVFCRLQIARRLLRERKLVAAQCLLVKTRETSAFRKKWLILKTQSVFQASSLRLMSLVKNYAPKHKPIGKQSCRRQ